jgi:glycosyltransferase involved in cell wall biosynthesis
MFINIIRRILKIFGINDEPIQEIKKMNILIITKSKNNYGFETPNTLSTGLFNSAQHIVFALESVPGITINLVSVVDNNSIDREVTLYRPDIVIIEALWVVPEKFAVLKALHPTVKWVIRIHSEVPFLSFEGIAFNWIRRYLSEQNIYVALNSKDTFRDFKMLYRNQPNLILCLPNYFRLPDNDPQIKPDFDDEVHIGCFGAIRGLKNQMAQALAAIEYADRNGAKLYYHINTGRTEGFGSENILNNIREVFAARTDHSLVEHSWLSNDDFQLLLTNEIDISLQVSFSETFNLVAADSVACGVPIIASGEIDWAPSLSQVRKSCSVKEIAQRINKCYIFRRSVVGSSIDNLIDSNRLAKRTLIEQLSSIL